jgi:hypothetical protein
MQEQNFEKQVQKKLEELNLSPSAPVWKRVEDQIRKKKDRRRIFFWMLPFALLGGGVYFYSIQNNPGERTTTTNVAEGNIPGKNNNQNSSITTQNNTTASTDQSTTVQKQPTLSAEKPGSEKTVTKRDIVSESTSYRSTPKLTVQKKEERGAVNRNAIINAEEGTKKIDRTTAVKQDANSVTINESVQNNGPTQLQGNEKIIDKSEKPVDNPSANNNNVVTDSLVNNDVINDTINKTPSPSETKDTLAVASANAIVNTQKTQVKVKTKKTWKFSASLAGGSSGIATSAFGKLSQGGAASFDALRFYNAPTSAQNTSGNGPLAITRYPSDISNAFSFAAGAGLNKELSDRLQFTTGLTYHFYSTSITVGKKVYQADTITRENKNIRVENFYQASSAVETSTRKNNYHFVELPIGLDWQVIKNIPLQLQTGFRIGRLIKTNALHYDGQQGIYYEDEELFKRTQISFYTGISYRILKINKASLYIGPKAQFQLSNLLKKKDYGEQHLYFTGVQTYISF